MVPRRKRAAIAGGEVMIPMPQPDMYENYFHGGFLYDSEMCKEACEHSKMYYEETLKEYGDARAAEARLAALEEAAKVCGANRMLRITCDFDEGYNHALGHCDEAIEALKGTT
jgi:hypothetical protein